MPVFSSDALSSVAYATEAILLILILLGRGALSDQIWLSLAIVVLIILITISYTQTIRAYPQGGGSYIVASENLGTSPGLVAAAALLIDYILTVSVSTSAGVAAILSAIPSIRHVIPDAQVTLSLVCIGLVAFANLRGMKESGSVFAIPTYGFIVAMTGLIIFGAWKIHVATNAFPAPQVLTDVSEGMHNAPRLFILLRAFAAGCTALTGIEAVSDGVQAFKAPESKNAAKTLIIMSSILTFLFIGLGIIAKDLPFYYNHFSIYSTNDPRYITLTAQVAAFVFGNGSAGFYVVQMFVAAILILAANTAFADFPRLSMFIARDGFMPRYMARQGDKLVFHNGIIALAILAGLLVFFFKGQLDALLPLYAVGVFTAFTLSQAGMVAHWFKDRGKNWHVRAFVNSVGMSLCAIVLVIIAATKFAEGAWLVMILIPIIYTGFILIHRRYEAMTRQLSAMDEDVEEAEHIVLVLIPRLHRGILNAVRYSHQLKGEIQAVHVTLNERTLPDLHRQWEKYGQGVPLVVLPSPYRSLIQPVLDYVDQIREERPDVVITVVVAEAVSTKWYQRLLTENVAQQLKVALARRRRVVVANTRYFLN
ncbi:MAG TPA: APC family permease [Fimbriimonas sp.]|nr:APC family permease [Fimbriimonas sp.]